MQIAKIFQRLRMASLNMRERLEVTLETLPAGPVHQMQPWGFASIDSFLPSAVETKKAAPPAGMRAERAGSVLAQHCIAEGEIQVRRRFSFFFPPLCPLTGPWRAREASQDEQRGLVRAAGADRGG